MKDQGESPLAELKMDIPEGFYEPETRSGYFVSAQMKKIWAVELDLLSELLRVCRKHSIKIFASGGTLLGTVRHKGFIPWDDDIDMMMFRSDYDMLCEAAKDEFRYPYFFQQEHTDPGCLYGYAKLRNSSTTRIEGKFRDMDVNQGIFIDIFPLDNVSGNKLLWHKRVLNAKFWRFSAYLAADFSTRAPSAPPEGKDLWAKAVYALNPLLSGFVTRHGLEERAFTRFEKVCRRYNDRDTQIVSTLSFNFEKRLHWKWRSDFENITWLPFEFLSMPVGTGYEHALETRYGNWKEFVVEGYHHDALALDTEKPYTETLRGLREGKS